MIRTNAPNVSHALDRDAPVLPVAETTDEETYFAQNPAPDYLPELREQVDEFVAYHRRAGNRIALVTSGGTTVPLENNTVRFIDNFSAGTRGATSAELFLEAGYAVIFLHRQFSLMPYSRHYSHSTNCFLDYMVEGDDGASVKVDDKYADEMIKVLRKYQAAKRKNLLHLVPFTTVNQYLHTLRMISLELGKQSDGDSGFSPRNVIFYLAAAVSDFFLPRSKTTDHKIQSSGSKLELNLDPVPKFLKRVVESWSPDSMIISFKLETDPNLLLPKARQALERYQHQLVIGNLLQNRKQEVTFVTPSEVNTLRLTDEEVKENIAIESLIIPQVISMHEKWIARA